MNKALFLDRDGVINYETNFVHKISDFKFIDGVFETCLYFQNNGFMIFVITNQSGISRGYYSENEFQILTNWMIKEFKKNNITINKVYFCPHYPQKDGECLCRKPNPNMILNAKTEFNIDLSESILIGDRNSDIEAGISAGIKSNFLINTGHKINENKFNVRILENLKELIT